MTSKVLAEWTGGGVAVEEGVRDGVVHGHPPVGPNRSALIRSLGRPAVTSRSLMVSTNGVGPHT